MDRRARVERPTCARGRGPIPGASGDRDDRHRSPAPPPRTRPSSWIDATKRFGDTTAVEDISLVVPAGTILGVIGPSGAGKTTTIRMLTGALAPTEGDGPRARRGPAPVPPPDARADRLHAPAVHALPGPDRARERRLRGVAVRDPVADPPSADARGPRAGRPVGRPRSARRRTCRAACSAASSWPARSSITRRCCSSTSRRPGIDPLLRARIWEELHRLRDEGRTLLVTTQYVNEAEECDTVALIADGRLIALATPDELRRLAIGGDLIDVETDGAVRRRGPPAALPRSTRSTRSTATHVRVIVDDAATALPGRGRGRRRSRRRGAQRAARPAVLRRRSSPRSSSASARPMRRRPRPPTASDHDGAGRLMRAFLAVIVRLLAFVGKELIETLRRPGAIVSLVLGPFLIMAIFGLGYNGVRRPLEHDHRRARRRASCRPMPRRYQELAGGGLAGRRGRRRTGRRPRHAWPTARSTSSSSPRPIPRRPSAPASSPSSRSWSTRSTRSPSTTPASSRPACRAPSTARSSSARRRRARAMPWRPGSPRPRPSRPRSSPRRPAPRSSTSRRRQPGVLAYFGPAVLALILQHLAVTLVALSLVRERTTGVMELFRIAPVSTSEILAGKVLAYGLLGGAHRGAHDGAAGRRLRRPDARRRWPSSSLAIALAARRLARASACSSPSSPTPSARPSSCRCSCCSRRCSSAASCCPSTSSPSRSGPWPTSCR